MNNYDVVYGVMPQTAKKAADDYILPYAFTIIVVLLLLVIYLWWTRGSVENYGTMPTSTMRAIQQETVNVGGSIGGAGPIIAGDLQDLRNQIIAESMDGGPAVVTSAIDPSSSAMPGSPAWQVLNSPAFACNSRDLNASADYLAYQQAAARSAEGFASGVGAGLSDAEARKILTGQ